VKRFVIYVSKHSSARTIYKYIASTMKIIGVRPAMSKFWAE